MILFFKNYFLSIVAVIILLFTLQPLSFLPVPLEYEKSWEILIDSQESTTTQKSPHSEKLNISQRAQDVFQELFFYAEFLEKNGSFLTPDSEQNMAKILMKLPRTDVELIAKIIYCVKHPAKCMWIKIEKITIPFEELQRRLILDLIELFKKLYQFHQATHPSPKSRKTDYSCRGKEVFQEFQFYAEFLGKNGSQVSPDVEQNLAKILEKFPRDDFELFADFVYCFSLFGPPPPRCEWFESVKNTITFEELQKRVIQEIMHGRNETATETTSATTTNSMLN